jgi:hypothetical protein
VRRDERNGKRGPPHATNVAHIARTMSPLSHAAAWRVTVPHLRSHTR